MANKTKVVRFYRPVMIEPDNSRQDITGDFWLHLRNHVDGLSPADRRVRMPSATFRGDAGIGKAPATPYLRVGRLRTAIDWPDTVDSADAVAPLTLTGRDLLENAYLVPFGTVNQVALMNPIRGIVPLSAIEAWIGAVLHLPAQGRKVELMPEVDTQALEKLSNAEGVASLTVRIPYDADLKLPAGSSSVVDDALRQADAASRGELDVEVSLTYGRRTPKGGMSKTLQNVARRLARDSGVDRLDVSMILEEGDGFRREHHNLLRDEIASSAVFDRADDQQMTVDEILEAIDGAIAGFRAR